MFVPTFLYLLVASFVATVNGQCPTMGMTSYALVTITTDITEEMFKEAIDYYGQMASTCGGAHEIEMYFGYSIFRTVPSDGFDSLWDQNEVTNLYTSSIAQFLNKNDTESNKLADKLEYFIQSVNNTNQRPATVVQKKTITIITDYINPNLTKIIPVTINALNAQAYILSLNPNVTDFYDDDKRFTTCETDVTDFDNCSKAFCDRMVVDLSTKVNKKPAQAVVYMANITGDLSMLKTIADKIAQSEKCSLKPNDIVTNFLRVHFLSKEYDKQIYLPWIGNMTTAFYDQCINETLLTTLNITGRETRADDSPDVLSCVDTNFFYRNFLNDLKNDSLINGSVILYDTNPSACLRNALVKFTAIKPDLQIFINTADKKERTNFFQDVVDPCHEHLEHANRFHVDFIDNADDIRRSFVVCKNHAIQANLTIAEKYKYLEPMDVALDQLVIILVLCSMSAIGIGSFFYKVVKRKIDDEDTDAEAEFKAGKIYLKNEPETMVDLLPWQAHIDRVVINYEFPLGEGGSFVIYMGKLKGKAPVMQWVNMGEMKQFQDCAVAIRVPRRYDYEEEQQLNREIHAMKSLKYHDYIANLLGWVNKNNFACTILELTHTNLLKYVIQLKDGIDFCVTEDTSVCCLLPFKQFLKIITQISDAMSYIASKGLVHRDLAARNILLTTGLRAKISGFNFCSLVGDDDFEPSKPTFRHLPTHWMAIEAMTHGKFGEKSDVWSFAMLLYEIYSLGDVPLANVRDSTMLKALKSGERPLRPAHASEEIYSIMCRCWHRYAERRPNFTELHAVFQSILERQFDNPAFEFEEDSS